MAHARRSPSASLNARAARLAIGLGARQNGGYVVRLHHRAAPSGYRVGDRAFAQGFPCNTGQPGFAGLLAEPRAALPGFAAVRNLGPTSERSELSARTLRSPAGALRLVLAIRRRPATPSGCKGTVGEQATSTGPRYDVRPCSAAWASRTRPTSEARSSSGSIGRLSIGCARCAAPARATAT